MIYRLRIGQALAGESPEESAARLSGEGEAEEIAPDPFEIRRLGVVLATAVPGLLRSEAPKGWVLTHGGSGAQIRMSGDEFGITVPPAFSAGTAQSGWSDLWQVLTVLQREGYSTYDPQLGRLLDLERDLEAVIAAHTRPQTQSRATAATAASVRKPWWKIW